MFARICRAAAATLVILLVSGVHLSLIPVMMGAVILLVVTQHLIALPHSSKISELEAWHDRYDKAILIGLDPLQALERAENTSRKRRLASKVLHDYSGFPPGSYRRDYVCHICEQQDIFWSSPNKGRAVGLRKSGGLSYYSD